MISVAVREGMALPAIASVRFGSLRYDMTNDVEYWSRRLLPKDRAELSARVRAANERGETPTIHYADIHRYMRFDTH